MARIRGQSVCEIGGESTYLIGQSIFDIMQEYTDLLKTAWSNLLAKIDKGSISVWSEGDLHFQLFRELHDLCTREGWEEPFQIHAEISVAGYKPDLVLGNEEVIIELKHEREGTGGYTQHRGAYDEVVRKISRNS